VDGYVIKELASIPLPDNETGDAGIPAVEQNLLWGNGAGLGKIPVSNGDALDLNRALNEQ
jgi:hypothetical protein